MGNRRLRLASNELQESFVNYQRLDEGAAVFFQVIMDVPQELEMFVGQAGIRNDC